MKTKKLLITTILFIFLVNKGWSFQIIVAPSGADYRSIQQGVNAANVGDTILIKSGIYNEMVSFPKSGSENNYITLLGEAGAIIDGSDDNGVGITISSINYIKVIGFEVRNFKGNRVPMGVSVTGSSSNIELRNNKVHHIENANGNAHGIAIYGTDITAISNIVVDGNEIRDCKLGQSEALVLNGNVTNFIVSNNIVHDNDNIGIDFIGFERQGPERL